MEATSATAVENEAFLAFLRAYASRQSLLQSTAADFFAILAEHTSADISDLVQAYFQKPPTE